MILDNVERNTAYLICYSLSLFSYDEDSTSTKLGHFTYILTYSRSTFMKYLYILWVDRRKLLRLK